MAKAAKPRASATATHRRDAVTGQYVSKKYAEKNPNTTVTERDKKKKK